jgi:EAL domain-containing protein (putative c-di-GMP-specific phosphodiesterase class I)
VLKIDKSFVLDMGTSSSAAEIVKTIIDLGHVLKMNVIAEGIETEEQLRQLKKAGCDGIQGYWLSPPMPALTASNWLKSYSAL